MRKHSRGDEYLHIGSLKPRERKREREVIVCLGNVSPGILSPKEDFCRWPLTHWTHFAIARTIEGSRRTVKASRIRSSRTSDSFPSAWCIACLCVAGESRAAAGSFDWRAKSIFQERLAFLLVYSGEAGRGRASGEDVSQLRRAARQQQTRRKEKCSLGRDLVEFRNVRRIPAGPSGRSHPIRENIPSIKYS